MRFRCVAREAAARHVAVDRGGFNNEGGGLDSVTAILYGWGRPDEERT
jgi:hypothetical protein